MRAHWLFAIMLAGCSRAYAKPTDVGGFAVLELFTSEGCSSCPPADALLDQLTREAARAGQPVYALSFHVDYWNDLGWRDPFSRPEASSRQRAYASALADSRVYTPELVVNGREAFVGSSEARAHASLREALARKAGPRLALQTHAAADRLQVHFVLSSPRPPRAVLNLALVQNRADSRVTRGENLGRMLSHVNVVREFRSLTPDQIETGQASLPLPAAGAAYTLIGYLQELPSLAIVAAASTPLR